MKYQKHFEELEEIAQKLEKGEIPIDDLAVKIKRAQKLLEICNKILSETQENIQKLLHEDSSD